MDNFSAFTCYFHKKFHSTCFFTEKVYKTCNTYETSILYFPCKKSSKEKRPPEGGRETKEKGQIIINKSPLSHQEFLDSMGEVKIFKQDSFTFPDNGSCVSLAATGQNTHEEYLLDINKKNCTLSRITYQNRVRKAIVLLRFDVDTKPHKNPDGDVISSTHLHVYQEGYLDAWAYLLSDPRLKQILKECKLTFNLQDLITPDNERCFEAFTRLCNIARYPITACSLF